MRVVRAYSSPQLRAKRLAGAAGVAVKADDPQVDRVESDEDGDEPGAGDQRRAPASPGAQRVGVQVDGVDDPGYGGPGLLGVPAPPAAPGVLPPDGAGHSAKGPDGKA